MSYLRRTLGTPTNQKKFTFSAWIKGDFKVSGSNDSCVLSCGTNGDNKGTKLFNLVRTDGTPQIYLDDNTGYYLIFNNHDFQDVSAWYHIVLSYDTTQSTNTNRVKLYVNGNQIPNSEATATGYPPQDHDLPTLASGQTMTVGADTKTNNHGFNGYMADVNFVDGSALAPTDFGETDSTTGIWKPKSNISVTYGTNGFRLEFKNSGALGTDTSGNNNTFTPTSFTTNAQCTDTPTNNFPVWIPGPNIGLFDGMLHAQTARSGNWDGITASMGVTRGKWYIEGKQNSTDTTPRLLFGMAAVIPNLSVLFDGKGGSGDPTSSQTNSYWIQTSDNTGGYLSANGSYGGARSVWASTNNDIWNLALDLDNGKFYAGKNGSYYGEDGNASNPVTASNPGYAITANRFGDSNTKYYYQIFIGLRNDGSETNGIYLNQGNPNGNFAITSNSGDGYADANGYGKFQYQPPSGYYAMCTKNLKQYG